jgi:hypothetical protein
MPIQGLHYLLITASLATIPSPVAIAADFRKSFHIVGLPDTKRGERVDVSFGLDELVFERKSRSGLAYHLPYRRIQQALLLHADRHYEKSTAAAGAATGALGLPFGALLILQKHKVDTLVIDYQSESGGRMGIVLQLERDQEPAISARLKEHGVTVIDPPPDPSPPPSRKKNSAQPKVQNK